MIAGVDNVANAAPRDVFENRLQRQRFP